MLRMWNELWNYFYFSWVHPMFKWVLRRVTGKCELLRITYSEGEGACRTKRVESSLKHSRAQELKRLLVDDRVDIDAAVETIMQIKSISPQVHAKFSPILHTCLSQICGYRQLIVEVETVRRVPYSSDNIQHEAQLQQLWDTLCPNTPLEKRISKQWTEIGFQGDDPMTDFRGMGILGLQNLLYFVNQHTQNAHQLLSHSSHPQYGYSFAIVGINITGLALQLLTGGHLRTHFYNVVHGVPKLEHFHQVYCYLLYEFDRFWFEEKPKDIMQFNYVKGRFQKKMIQLLKSESAVLTGTMSPALDSTKPTGAV